MRKMIENIKRSLVATKGITTVEVILILVVLVGLVIIFKDQIVSIAQGIFTNITKNVNKIY